MHVYRYCVNNSYYLMFVDRVYYFFTISTLDIFNLSDDEDEYEESGGGNRLLGFMFGNVDDSGDLDVDYLDEVTILCYI